MTSGLIARWESDDVRLADVLPQPDKLRRSQAGMGTRASVLNLVVIGTNPETAQRARSAALALGAQHPGRFVVISPTAGADSDSRLAAAVELHDSDVLGRHLWWELIELCPKGPVLDHLDSLVDPLLLQDHQVVAWYSGGVPPAESVLSSASLVLVEAEPPAGALAEHLSRLMALIARRPVVDFAWLSIEPVRRALAELFARTSGERAKLPEQPRAVEARVIGPPLRAALVAGWLYERLGLEAASVLIEPRGVGGEAPVEAHLRLSTAAGTGSGASEQGGDVPTGESTWAVVREEDGIASASLGDTTTVTWVERSRLEVLGRALRNPQRDRWFEAAASRALELVTAPEGRPA
jgi:glucose-6-phosphate dehydrogenase assembly protein OpcA